MGIEENKATAAKLIVALGAADKESFLETVWPDAVWWTAGMPGTYTPENYFKFSADAALMLKEPNFNMKVVGVTAEGDRVAIEGETYTELKNGRIYNNKYHFLLVFRDGRISEVKEYLDSKHAFEVWEPDL